MQPFAANQPVTRHRQRRAQPDAGPRIEAVLHHSAGHYVLLSLLWTAGIVAVFAPLAVARFSRR